MFRPRVIPIILINDKDVVRTINYRNPKYIGDPMNVIKIFNNLNADEVIILNINKNRHKNIDFKYIKQISYEAFMPFSYGGGISSTDQISKLLDCGCEKVVLCSSAFIDRKLVINAVKKFGSQAVVVSIDYKKDFFGNLKVVINSGKKKTNMHPLDFAKDMADCGVGEIILNSIDRDGTFKGYDIENISLISDAVTVPIIASTGCDNLSDMLKVYKHTKCSAIAAGSKFVYFTEKKGILVNYLNDKEKRAFLK